MIESEFADHGYALPQGDGKDESSFASFLRGLSVSPARLALAYLVALSAAEVCTVLIDPRVGLVLHGIILVVLTLHAGIALTLEQPAHQLLLCLLLAPLIRVLSLSLPMAGFPQVYWYFLTSVPLFASALVATRTLGFSWASIGLNLRGLPLQALVALAGLAFGYVEYLILRPKPLAASFTLREVWLPALILLVCTGFLEELIFRGLLQKAAIAIMGRLGVVYVAVLFAVLHVGYKSLIDVLFVLVVGIFFGWVALRTGSILGVTAAHGLTNILLFLVMPFLVGPAAALPPRTSLPAQPAPAAAVATTLYAGAPAARALPVVFVAPAGPALPTASGAATFGPTRPAYHPLPQTQTVLRQAGAALPDGLPLASLAMPAPGSGAPAMAIAGATETPPTPVAELIVDELSPGFSRGGATGYWFEATAGYLGHSFFTYTSLPIADNWARWTPQLAGPGLYEVMAYVAAPYVATEKAHYVVVSAQGEQTRLVSQRLSGSGWVSLGTHRFVGTGGEYVGLSDVTGEAQSTARICFDAVKFVFRGK